MAADNIIEIVGKFSVQGQQDLTKFINEMVRLGKEAGLTDKELEKLTKGYSSGARSLQDALKNTNDYGDANERAHLRLSHLSAGLSQITSAFAATQPQYRSIIGLTDNLAFSMLNAGSRADTFAGGLKAALLVAFNPITLAIVGLTAGLGYL